MDTSESGIGFLDDLASIRNLIIDKFSLLFRLLQERKELLLNQLLELEQCYRREEERRGGELQQLLIAKEQTFCNLKDNKHVSTLREMILPLEARVRELSVESGSLEKIQLEWDSELEMKIQCVGVIHLNGRKSIIDHYKSKSRPVHAFGTHRTNSSMPGELKFPNAIAFDQLSKRIYVCDGGNDRVQVFDNTGEFKFMISEGMATPFGICIFGKLVFVTQMLGQALNVYEINGNFVRSFSNQLDNPKGVSVSSVTENIYICDSRNRRIVILNQSLNAISLIQCNSSPDDVKTTDNQIFVLAFSNPCIFIYDYNHQFIRNVISNGPGMQVLESYNIFIDQSCNILLADTVANCVLVFTGAGDLIHRFGATGDGLGEFVKPRGIAMDSDGRIVIVSQNSHYSIQMF